MISLLSAEFAHRVIKVIVASLAVLKSCAQLIYKYANSCLLLYVQPSTAVNLLGQAV